jgi:hypothetical protein
MFGRGTVSRVLRVVQDPLVKTWPWADDLFSDFAQFSGEESELGI